MNDQNFFSGALFSRPGRDTVICRMQSRAYIYEHSCGIGIGLQQTQQSDRVGGNGGQSSDQTNTKKWNRRAET